MKENGNREFKSDVFSMLLEDKANALSVYNAMNDSDYTDTEAVEVCTMEKGISLTVRNDAAFVVDSSLSIYEHQSTVCPNMPIRSLIYFSITVQEMLKGKNIYGRRLLNIPVPKFVVFYNGDEKQPEQYEMLLSSAYERHEDNPQLELKCKVYNINYGKNKKIMDKCSVLREYSIFVERVRDFHRQQGYNDLKYAIDRAIDKCIKDNILREFLINRRSEVAKVMQLDYTFERQITLEREDARSEGFAEGRAKGLAEGREEGRAKGREEGWAEGREEGWAEGLAEEKKQSHIKELTIIIKKLKKNKSLEQIADDLETEVSEIETICEVARKYAPDYDIEAICEEVYSK